MATFITTQSGSTSFLMVESTTEYIKINSTIHQSNGEIEYTLDDPNGEYTLVSCLNDGTPSGEITSLGLSNNQIISFDGTGLDNLTYLDLTSNPLVSFNGGDMSQITTLHFPEWGITTLESFDGGNMTGLTDLYLNNNQLTSFNGTGLTSLVQLHLNGNQLTSFDGTGLSNLNWLDLSYNQLTSFDGTGLSSLIALFLTNNQLTSIDITGLFQNLPNDEFVIRVENNNFTPLINNSLISQLVDITANFGQIVTSGGRTSASEVDYQELVAREWDLTGLDLVLPPTFITSKAVDETIYVYVETSIGYWKYQHNGVMSEAYGNGGQEITVANANGEFTIIPCLEDGTISGDIAYLGLQDNQLTSFDGTGLSSLTNLNLAYNQLTSFNGTGLSGLNYLSLSNNQITSFDGTGLSSLTELSLDNNQLTSFDGTGLSGLTNLNLAYNQLTSFTGTGLSSLTSLGLQNNQLTSFDGTDLSSLIELALFDNQLTSFDGTGLSSLLVLDLPNNQLTSFDGTGLSSLTNLYLQNNQLTSIDITGLFQNLPNGEFSLGLNDNPMTQQSNNSLLSQLVSITADFGNISTSNGRTSASNTNYDDLIGRGWQLEGFDLIPPTTFITSKAVGETITVYIATSTGYWKYKHNGVISNLYNNPNGEEITVENPNGEFTIIPCAGEGNVFGNITGLGLSNNQITSFSGTGLGSLNALYLDNNQLTSFDGTGLSSLLVLELPNNQLTSFDGTGLSSLTQLYLQNNQLTSFSGGDISSLTRLYLQNNQLTSIDITDPFQNPADVEIFLYLNGNPMTPQSNNSLLSQLVVIPANYYGEIATSNGRTAVSEVDYQELIARGWQLEGLDLVVISSNKLRIKGVNTSN